MYTECTGLFFHVTRRNLQDQPRFQVTADCLIRVADCDRDKKTNSVDELTLKGSNSANGFFFSTNKFFTDIFTNEECWTLIDDNSSCPVVGFVKLIELLIVRMAYPIHAHS